jgi:hypothetical protein
MKSILYLSTALLIVLFSCKSNKYNKPQLEEAEKSEVEGMHKVAVTEVRQANAYTYLKTIEGSEEHWLAVSKMEASVGDIYYFTDMLVMNDFTSKDLDTTFAEIYFVNDLLDSPTSNIEALAEKYPEGKKPDISQHDVNIEPTEGGVSVAELYKNKAKYDGKKVKVKGKVFKFNDQIMERNWVHIQDGSEFNGKFDLTVTTQAYVKAGQVVEFEGVLAVDKDFGAGYQYEIILESAELLDEVEI